MGIDIRDNVKILGLATLNSKIVVPMTTIGKPASSSPHGGILPWDSY